MFYPALGVTLLCIGVDFKDRMDNVVDVCFYNNDRFFNVVRESFQYFINQRHNKPAEVIGYCRRCCCFQLSSALSFISWPTQESFEYL